MSKFRYALTATAMAAGVAVGGYAVYDGMEAAVALHPFRHETPAFTVPERDLYVLKSEVELGLGMLVALSSVTLLPLSLVAEKPTD